MKKAFALAVGVGLFASCAGCTSPNAGGEASAIRIQHYGDGNITVRIDGDGNGTATAAPETGEQTTTGSTNNPSATVPIP